jgi:hypothetical protein
VTKVEETVPKNGLGHLHPCEKADNLAQAAKSGIYVVYIFESNESTRITYSSFGGTKAPGGKKVQGEITGPASSGFFDTRK